MSFNFHRLVPLDSVLYFVLIPKTANSSAVIAEARVTADVLHRTAIQRAPLNPSDGVSYTAPMVNSRTKTHREAAQKRVTKVTFKETILSG